MKTKIKCNRCREITSLNTSMNSVRDAINSLKAKGMKTNFLDDGLLILESKMRGLEATKCECVWIEQDKLPFSNTGVKIYAFPEGIA